VPPERRGGGVQLDDRGGVVAGGHGPQRANRRRERDHFRRGVRAADGAGQDALHGGRVPGRGRGSRHEDLGQCLQRRQPQRAGQSGDLGGARCGTGRPWNGVAGGLGRIHRAPGQDGRP
jgi:hypothetical protein